MSKVIDFDEKLDPTERKWAYCQDLLITLNRMKKDAPSFETAPWFSTLSDEILHSLIGPDLSLSPIKRIARCRFAFTSLEKMVFALSKNPHPPLVLMIYHSAQLYRLSVLLSQSAQRLDSAEKIHATLDSPLTNAIKDLKTTALKLMKTSQTIAQTFAEPIQREKKKFIAQHPSFSEEWKTLLHRFRGWPSMGFWLRHQISLEPLPDIKKITFHLHRRWEKLADQYYEVTPYLSAETPATLPPYWWLFDKMHEEKKQFLRILESEDLKLNK